jgi:cytochrome c553
MFFRIGLAMSLICIGLASTASAEPDLDNGRVLARTNCAHCHGRDGNARSTSFQPVPMLAGQPAVYLVQEMQNYATGTREDKSKRLKMSKALSSLNGKDFEDIAAYYAAQKRY